MDSEALRDLIAAQQRVIRLARPPACPYLPDTTNGCGRCPRCLEWDDAQRDLAAARVAVPVVA